jgi:hypothetical protein
MMTVDWKLEITDPNGLSAPKSAMNEIYSYVIPKETDRIIYGCGYKWIDPSTELNKNAVAFKMNTDGEIQYLKVWGESKGNDVCKAVSFDERKKQAIFML